MKRLGVKFDRKQCMKCKYHGTIGSRTMGNHNCICCDYALLAGEACLKRAGVDGYVYDRRGDGGECQLFEEGEALGSAEVNKQMREEVCIRRLERKGGR